MLQELPVEDVVPLPVATGAQVAASRRFTRVTFAGPTGRADVSVPDDLPAALVIEQVRPLLDAAAGDRWVLTRPATPARARMRIAMERAETAVLLASGVAVLAAFDAHGMAFAVVR